MSDRRYIVQPSTSYSKSGIDIVADCAAIEFYVDPTSTTIPTINGRPLAIGSAWSPSDQQNEHDISKYLLQFDSALVCIVWVTRKVYF